MRRATGIAFALAALALAPAAAARAQDQGQNQGKSQAPGGWYISGFLGGTFLEGARNQGTGGSLFDVESSNSPGYQIRGAFGAYRSPQVRVEGEIGYRRAGIDSVSVTNDGELGAAAGVGSFNGLHSSAKGHVSALSFMANAYYDYDTDSPWHPYFALGIGFARVSLDAVKIAGVPVADDEDWTFAYQAGIGIGYEITPSTTLALDYRYFATLDPTFRNAAGGQFTSDFTSHNLSVGIRYRF